ncbi:primosomal protein [Nakamurella sp.]|uniref:primosomal protein n=1 Tax=Nakamurella sp. TaxID=1869182 RepID=UPI003B3BDAC9
MAADIIPIQLGLTDGNVYTLWAPQWLEDGEEWEAFLGHGDDLYVFPSPAHLAAFIRSSDEHDLIDHPEWDTAAELLVDELRPDDDHVYDIVGVPDLVAEIPDIWTLAALTDTVTIVRSLADVCDLEVVDEILGSADGFAVLPLGQTAFTGRNGEKLWNEMGAVIAERWDEVIDAIDAIVSTPEIDAEELTSTKAEQAAISAVDKTGETVEPEEDEERDEDLEFWDETGVDCLEITVGGRTGYTLRCYLGDEPVFLAENHRIQVYSSAEELENYLMTADVTHRLSTLEVWPEIRTAVTDGEAAVLAGPENTYRLDGLADALKEGPEAVDGRQLELAVELLIDGALERGDEETVEAVGSSTPLGNLISAITRPDPDRLPPSPPFDDEAAAWSVLVDRFAATLEWDGSRG